MDLSDSFQSTSEQLTYPDIGERIVIATVTKVVPRGDKPKDPAIHLAEFPGKPLLPGVNVGSLLRKAWGLDGKQWVGQKVELYGDPDVYFGKEKTGGVRVSRVSGITEPVSVPRRGKGARGQITAQPLTDPAPVDWPSRIADCDSLEVLKSWWTGADAATQVLLKARADELKAAERDDAIAAGVDSPADLDVAAKGAEDVTLNFDDEAGA